MIVAGDKVLISGQMVSILLVLAVTAAATVFYFRLRRLRQAARMARRSAHGLPVGVEISCAEFNADGRDGARAHRRWSARGTALYDCALSVAGNGKAL